MTPDENKALDNSPAPRPVKRKVKSHIAFDHNGNSYMCMCDNPNRHSPDGDADVDIFDDSWGQPEADQWED